MNPSLQRRAAAKHLGMSPDTFDKVKRDIPSSPLYPGSPVRVWRASDLEEWRLTQIKQQQRPGRSESMDDLLRRLSGGVYNPKRGARP